MCVYRELNYTLLYINVGAEDFSGSCFRLRSYNFYTLHVCSMAKIVDLESIISLVVIISMIAAKKNAPLIKVLIAGVNFDL